VTNHSVAREVVTFFTLPPGDYIVVPQTNIPNLDGKFLLRVFTDEQSNIWEVNEDNMIIRNISSEFMEETSPNTVTAIVFGCKKHTYLFLVAARSQDNFDKTPDQIPPRNRC
jgi:hypothetical protein